MFNVTFRARFPLVLICTGSQNCLCSCEQHDASHTSIGWNYRWWSIIGRGCMDWFAGGSLTSWYNQHVIGHHVYTNVMGADPVRYHFTFSYSPVFKDSAAI